MLRIRPYRFEELPWMVQRGTETAQAQLVERDLSAATPERVAQQLHLMYQNTLQVPLSTALVADWPPGSTLMTPAGYALLMPQGNPFTGTPEIIVMDIYTDPTLRGQGVGQQLLARAGEYARSIGCAGLAAQVALHNQPSQRLFRTSEFAAERVVFGKRLS